MGDGSGQERSSGVTVLSGGPVLGTAIQAFCSVDGFFLRQMEPAMGTSHHVGWAGVRRLGVFSGLGWPAAAFEGPDRDQDDQQPDQVFHAARPIKTSSTNREPA